MSAGWRPEPGDTVSGKVVDADRIEGGYGAYLVLAIDTGSAVVDVHAFHDTLVRQLRKHAVQIGDRVSITYVGRADDDDPKAAYIYRVTGGRVPTIDWDATEVRAASSTSLDSIASDVPIDTGGLPPAPGHRAIGERTEERFGNEPPY